VITIQSADGKLSLTEVNENDRVRRTTKVVDVNGLETTYTYSDGGRTITASLPNNSERVTKNYLDGQIKSITGNGVIPEYYTYGVNADGTTWTRVDTVNNDYHEIEDITSATNLRYLKTTKDMLGLLIGETSPSFLGTGNVSTEYNYDQYNRLIAQSQTGMANRLYEYDAVGKIIRSGLDMNGNGQLDLASGDRITDNDRIYQIDEGVWYDVSTTKVYPVINNSTVKTVSVSKRQLSGFTGNLVQRKIDEDIHGNRTIRSTEIDSATKTVTERTDTPFSSIDAERVTINGLLMSQNSDTVAAATTYIYDDLERLIAVKEPRHTASSQIEYYPETKQIFTRTDPAGNTTAYTYFNNGKNGAGQIQSTTDALGKKTYFAYNKLGDQVRTWGETNYPQKYTYNEYGELASLTTWRDPDNTLDFTIPKWPSDATIDNGDTTAWSYDAATGLLRGKRYADGKRTRYIYNTDNRLTRRIWARSRDFDTIYQYSKKTGELKIVNYKDADTADITYKYDRLGRQIEVTDATGKRAFKYDPNTLQLDYETLDTEFYNGYQLFRKYDPQGRVDGYIFQNLASSVISTANYTYDKSGRFLTVSDGSDTFIYGYVPDSNLLASITAPKHSVSYKYEANRDLMTIIDNRASGASVSKYEYKYDALGRRADRSQSGSAVDDESTDTFDYNACSEVISSTNSVETAAEWNPTYRYDKIGNRKESTGFTSATYTANALNQYDTFTPYASELTTPDYDADGNLRSSGLWTYTWNSENRLTSATDGTTTLNFTYDYQGRLVKKDDGTNVEVYVYDGWNRIATFDVQSSTFNVQSSYLWGLDLSGSLQGAGGVGGLLKEDGFYPTFDANGNVMQKLDSESTTVMSVAYDPFGNVIEGTLVGEYGFSTKPLINDLDWYCYGFRYYDPVTGRWPNRDPIEEAGGVNLFVANMNDAINNYDLLGLKICFDGEAYAECWDGCEADHNSCKAAAEIARKSCESAAADVRDHCLYSCEYWLGKSGRLYQACKRGCHAKFAGTAFAVCHSAYQGMMTGCDISAAACGAGCYAGAHYTVDDGCPCDR
jgi:RHS repeat-associated protein